MEDLELRAAPGFIAPELRDEFPGLRLDWVTVRSRPGRSPREIRERLKELSSRYRGSSVVAMRTQPIPHAYRAFFHQIGLDPDATRIPIEAAALTRLLQGHFPSRNLVEDVLLISLVETGVPVWALDAARVEAGGLGIRTTEAGERLGSSPHAIPLPPGRLVVADARKVHALLFGEVAPDHRVVSATEEIALFAVSVEGVPAIHVEESLWIAVEALAG